MREMKGARRSSLPCAIALIVGLAAQPAMAGELEDRDGRGGATAPSAAQKRAVAAMDATVRWNRFGTPRSLLARSGGLGPRVQAAGAGQAARRWVAENRQVFRLASTEGLVVEDAGRFAGSNGHAVVLRQTFGGLRAGTDGVLTVGVRGSRDAGWEVVYAASSVSGEQALSGAFALSPAEAWARAAADVGRATSLAQLGDAKESGDWTTFSAPGFAQLQRARKVALPTYENGVRRAYETLVTDVRDGQATSYTHFVDAETGAVLMRQDNVHQSHPAAETFQGTLATTDGACDSKGPWTVAAGERAE